MSAALPRNQEPFAPASIHESIQNSILNPASTPAPTLIPPAVETNCLAHDTRNWLTVLRVYCDLLRSSGAVASGYEAWMEELSSAVERGQELVLSLLDSIQQTVPTTHTAGPFMKASVTSIAVSHSLVSNSPVSNSLDVGNAITRRLPVFQRLAGNNIHVEIETPDNAGNVSLSENAFERILQNLVGNAIEAMPHGGRLRIALCPASRRSAGTSHRSREKALLLRVHDTGNGIAPGRLPYIFEAGVSGKPKCGDNHGQHGFGLAIVRDLTERAGGTVRVRSHLGRGSCFEVELPTV